MTAPLDEKALAEARTSFEMENSLERAIRAYLEASPSPSEMEVVAMPGIWETKYLRPDARVCKADEVQSVLSQAQSAIAARDAQVLRLTEENEALRKERDEAIRYGSANYMAAAERADAIETRAEAAEARIKALEEALRPFARVADQCNRHPSGTSIHVNVDRLRDARATLSTESQSK